MAFLKQIEILTAIESLKENYFGYSSALKVLAELEPLVDVGLIPELIRTRQGFPKDRSLESYNHRLKTAIGIARKETNGGLSFLASMCIIALCSFLENAITEVVAQEVAQNPEKWKNYPKSLEAEVMRKSTGKIDSLNDARRRVKKQHESKQGNAFSKLLSLLNDVGWALDLEPASCQTLQEMYEVRNVIVHCGARVDDRLKRKVIKFEAAEIGAVMALNEEQFRIYLAAADHFVGASICSQI